MRKSREVVKWQDWDWTGACPAPELAFVTTVLLGGYKGKLAQSPPSHDCTSPNGGGE